MQIVFSDAQYWENFLPLTYTRPVSEIRIGILTFRERWQKLLKEQQHAFITENYLQDKYKKPSPERSLFIVPNFLPTYKIVEQIKDLKEGEALVYQNEIIAANIDIENFSLSQIKEMKDIPEDTVFVKNTPDIFSLNELFLNFDFELITKSRKSVELSSTNGFLGNKENLFIEEGATVEFATLSCKTGKVYIGRNAEIMEGSLIRGGLALCEGAKINMGAKIYGCTTIGPFCKIGGEVNNVVFLGYSNKGHDGFIGNSVIGEWCNLGANTNSSNLKNNYTHVKMWNYKLKKFINTGLQFCGLIMGDHSKTAINTQLNTGTTVGVSSNIFKTGFPPNLVENFSWGGMSNDEKFDIKKAYTVAKTVMNRRGISLSQEDKTILEYIHDNF